MGVRRLEYGKELEKGLTEGTLEQAHERAVQRAQASRVAQRKKAEEDLVRKVSRKLREVFGGGKTYAKKEFAPSRARGRYERQREREAGKKQYKTVRTKAVTRGLKAAGLTKAEIARLRGR